MRKNKIKSITKLPPKRVYAVKTTSGTFIADGLLHHNCIGCNVYNHGEQLLYRENIVRAYGEEKAAELLGSYIKWQSGKGKKISTSEMELMITKYTKFVEKYKHIVQW